MRAHYKILIYADKKTNESSFDKLIDKCFDIASKIDKNIEVVSFCGTPASFPFVEIDGDSLKSMTEFEKQIKRYINRFKSLNVYYS